MDSRIVREKVKGAYGISWSARVDRMTDNQVFAIYMRLVRDKKI
jgi:hypothetical protein